MRIASRRYGDDGQLADVEHALSADPASLALRFERACALDDLGASAAADAYGAVLALDERHLGALTNLGVMARDAGDLGAARALFVRAVTHHPLAALAQCNLGETLLELGDFAGAQLHFDTALVCEPASFAARRGLAELHDARDEPEAAAEQRRLAFGGRAFWPLPYHGGGTPLRVLLLVSGAGGDVVTEPFLDDRAVQTTLAIPEAYRAGTPLPAHDVLFNAIGDADRCAGALAHAAAIVAASPHAPINPPALVARTGRAANATRLATLAGVVAPRVERIARDRLDAAALAAGGWSAPLLVRAPGFHGGRHVARIDDLTALPAALVALPGRDAFVIAFADTRGADGAYRKYRVLSIDGRPYPAHLAISPDWKVHYQSGVTPERDDYRAEERAFLDDPVRSLGGPAFAALERIARSLALDYGGIDFALDRAGNVVAFEANATMAVYVPPNDARAAYRRPAYDAIVRAARSMIERRARTVR